MSRILRRIIEYWALLGGLVLLALALMTTWSAVAGVIFGAPLPGDFEMMEVGVAVAAFSFLPYCQLTGANVSADIFTQGLGPRGVAILGSVSALIALAFALVLFWRMYDGLADYQRYEETTTILRFPLWIAFIPALVSLALLACAASLSLVDSIRGARRAI